MTILYENQNIPKELEEVLKNKSSLHNFFELTFTGIKPKNYCGYVKLDGKNYFIAPKISHHDETNLKIFIYMLIFAYDINIYHDERIESENITHKIFEIFIKFFADELLKELKRGVFRSYITKEENLKVLRGKYIIDKNFTNFYYQNIYCEFDEFSADNELNRFFLYAIKIFKKHIHYKNLSRCEVMLDEVLSQSFDINRLNIDFDRTNKRYKKSFEVAIMILKKIIALPSSGSEKSFGFLFDMAEVFEKFVARLYHDIDSSTQTQQERRFGNLSLKPDIITKEMIIDTKYKKANSKDDLITADKYQMFTYGINFNKRDTMLLYPKHKVSVFENLELGKDENLVRLKMRSLDLNFDGEYGEFVEEMRKRVKML